MTFQHNTDNSVITGQTLRQNILRHFALTVMVFIGVTMAAINDYATRQVQLIQFGQRFADTMLVVVGFSTTTQNNMAIRVAGSLHQAHLTALINTNKAVTTGR